MLFNSILSSDFLMPSSGGVSKVCTHSPLLDRSKNVGVRRCYGGKTFFFLHLAVIISRNVKPRVLRCSRVKRLSP